MEAPALRVVTLGDLMRKGSTMNPQAIGAWEKQGATCALQAAFYAAKSENLI